MKQFLFIITLMNLSSCAQMMGISQNEGNLKKYQITQVENSNTSASLYNGIVRVKYVDFETLEIKNEEKIKNELLKESDAKLLRSALPKGGELVVTLLRPTIDTANLKAFSYILYKNGKEVKRWDGGSTASFNNIPSTPSHVGMEGMHWRNLDIVYLNETFSSEDSISLFVVDKILGGRDEFTLSYKKAKLN